MSTEGEVGDVRSTEEEWPENDIIHNVVSEVNPIRADCQPERSRLPAGDAEDARDLVASEVFDSRDDELGRGTSPNVFTYHGVTEDASFLRVELETASVFVRGESVEREGPPVHVEMSKVGQIYLPVV